MLESARRFFHAPGIRIPRPRIDAACPARGTLLHTAVTAPRGDELLPLSLLAERHPDLYARHIAKYAGREHRLRERVIPLDCHWADVVFFSPVDSAVLFDAVGSAGRGDCAEARCGPWTPPGSTRAGAAYGSCG